MLRFTCAFLLVVTSLVVAQPEDAGPLLGRVEGKVYVAPSGAFRTTIPVLPELAARKRPVAAERIERMLTGIVRQLESMGESEVTSSAIGELVMEGLRSLDPVAYVRFASVYRDFREAADFHEVLGEIAGRPVGLNDDAPAVAPDIKPGVDLKQ